MWSWIQATMQQNTITLEIGEVNFNKRKILWFYNVSFFFLLDQKQEPEPDTESEEQLRAFLAENFDNKPTEKNSGTGEFKPFPRDPAKQKRYEQYLVCVQNGRGKIALKILQVNSLEKVSFVILSKQFDIF